MDRLFLQLCKEFHVKRYKSNGVEIEFYPTMPEPMALDPVSLSKALSDSMPPDSAMMFASTEDMTHDPKQEAVTLDVPSM